MNNEIEKIKLANSDLYVSRLCIGGCPFGEYGWGEVEEKAIYESINRAVDLGVNFFDTADTYGLGESERNVGKGLGARRKDVVITTKFGVRVENGKTFYDNSREYIIKAVEGSLSRLNTDYIDLYQVHYRDGVTPLSEVVESLEMLKKQGKIRYYGLSNIFEKDIAELKNLKGKFITVQDEYSLAKRDNEEFLTKGCAEIGLTPMTWGSLGQGILTGKYDKNCKFNSNDRRSRDIYVNFHGEKLIKNLEIVEVLKDIAKEVNKSVSAVAIRFILDNIRNSIVLAGVKKQQAG